MPAVHFHYAGVDVSLAAVVVAASLPFAEEEEVCCPVVVG